MKRLATFAALALLVTVPVASEAAPKRKERTETLSYTAPNGATIAGAAATAGCGPADIRTCLNVTLTKDEKYIKFSAKDSSGQTVGIQYFAGETNDDYQSAAFTCGEGKGTYKKGGMVSFRIAIDTSCPSLPTSGTLTVVISNLP